jgi:hypothetical protein
MKNKAGSLDLGEFILHIDGLWAGGPANDLRQRQQNVLYSAASRPALEPGLFSVPVKSKKLKLFP